MISLIRSLTTKSVIPCGVIIASLALAGNAFAADTHVTKAAHVARRASARQIDLAQFIQSFFGGALSGRIGALPPRVTGGGSYVSSPSYDYSSPTVDTSSSSNDSLAASEQEDQEIQQMNDTNALNASMAAAEQENDAANAAALQTEINAGM
jgi:hypothetical protein